MGRREIVEKSGGAVKKEHKSHAQPRRIGHPPSSAAGPEAANEHDENAA